MELDITTANAPSLSGSASATQESLLGQRCPTRCATRWEEPTKRPCEAAGRGDVIGWAETIKLAPLRAAAGSAWHRRLRLPGHMAKRCGRSTAWPAWSMNAIIRVRCRIAMRPARPRLLANTRGVALHLDHLQRPGRRTGHCASHARFTLRNCPTTPSDGRGGHHLAAFPIAISSFAGRRRAGSPSPLRRL
jgi:hypothetical protein